MKFAIRKNIKDCKPERKVATRTVGVAKCHVIEWTTVISFTNPFDGALNDDSRFLVALKKIGIFNSSKTSRLLTCNVLQLPLVLKPGAFSIAKTL